ncbi:MAG: MipA/OmpV family protein [Kangiellaceae bacterium]|nr:MipA/OmpV family protein [Kangiellaceae bacterium]
MMNNLNIKTIAAAIMLVTTSSNALSAGITRDLRQSVTAEEAREDGGYFEIGATVYAHNETIFKGNEDDNKYGLAAQINGGYQWKGLFIDANDDDGFSFGYKAFNTQNWNYDIVAGSINGIDSDNSDNFESLRERESAGTFGLRATGFYDNNIFQVEAKKIHGDDVDGYQASVFAGTSWQYQNFTTYAIAGLHYSSSEVNDYYWGVRADEASIEFPEYELKASTTVSAELGFSYPINDSWEFKSKLNYAYGSEEFSKSPLRSDDSQHFVSGTASISYIF